MTIAMRQFGTLISAAIGIMAIVIFVPYLPSYHEIFNPAIKAFSNAGVPEQYIVAGESALHILDIADLANSALSVLALLGVIAGIITAFIAFVVRISR